MTDSLPKAIVVQNRNLLFRIINRLRLKWYRIVKQRSSLIVLGKKMDNPIHIVRPIVVEIQWEYDGTSQIGVAVIIEGVRFWSSAQDRLSAKRLATKIAKILGVSTFFK